MTVKQFASSVARGLPTLLTLLAIAAVAYLGHRTNWSIPRIGAVLGVASAPADDWCADHGVPESACVLCGGARAHAPAQEAPDWCAEHGVPESACTRCHPELIDAFKKAGDWCGGHQVPESQCLLCHPELKETLAARAPRAPSAHGGHGHAAPKAAAVADWCSGHGVPESLCTRCNRNLVPQFQARGDWCATHHLPASQCLRCNPGLKETLQKMAPPAPAGGDRTVQLASPQAARQAGIEWQAVESRGVSQHLEVNAQVGYDMTRYAQVSSRVGGLVAMVRAQAGQAVKRGQVLALIDASEVGQAKAEFLASAASLAARKTALERLRRSTEQGFRNQSELLAAEAEHGEASIRLFNARQALVNLGLAVPDLRPGEVPEEQSVRLLGLPESVRADLDPHQAGANLLPVAAPLDGVVVARHAVEGEMVEAGKPLLVVADTSRMWIRLDLPLSAVAQVRLGQEVAFRADGLEDEVAGTVVWISTAVDERTRTVEARAEVANGDGRLLAQVFGRARLRLASKAAATVVPASALQWDGAHHLVFIRQDDSLYRARIVRPGLRQGQVVEVEQVAPGDRVVVRGAYALLAQLHRGKLGAGCADEH